MSQIVPEVWLAQKDEFIFRIRVNETGVRWTFRVPRSTLSALDPTGTHSPQAVFDLFRSDIYSAAARIAATGDPRRQQTINQLEVRNPEQLQIPVGGKTARR